VLVGGAYACPVNVHAVEVYTTHATTLLPTGVLSRGHVVPFEVWRVRECRAVCGMCAHVYLLLQLATANYSPGSTQQL
jgi:hypothetical protein